MRERADDDWVPEVGPHPASLFQYFLDPVLEADRFQLMMQIGNHAARDLMVEMKLIVLERLADGFVFVFGDELKALGDLFDGTKVDIHLVAAPAAVAGKQLRRRVRGAVGQGRCRRMHRIDAVLDGLQRDIGRQPRKAVCVKLQWKVAEGLFHGRNKGRNPFRRQ